MRPMDSSKDCKLGVKLVGSVGNDRSQKVCGKASHVQSQANGIRRRHVPLSTFWISGCLGMTVNEMQGRGEGGGIVG